MPTSRAQVIMKPQGWADTKDFFVNTWYFNHGDKTPATASAITAGLQAFYLALPKSANSPNEPYGIKLYDVNLPAPNPPWLDGTMTVAQGTGGGFPPQITAVMSFFNDTDTAVPAGRRRGRLYLPFFPNSQLTGQFINSTYATAVENAIGNMNLALDGDAVHCGWSETRQELFFLDRYRIDNSFDIQRRRKFAATQQWEWAP